MGKWYGKWLKFKHSMSICFLCEINSTTEIILPSIQAVYHWYGPSIWAFAMKPPGFSPPPTPCVGVLKLVNLSSNGQIRWKVTGFMAMWPVHVYIKMSTCDITINTCVYLDIPHVAHQLIQYRWNLTTVCIGFFQGLEPQKSNFTMFIHPKNLSWNTVGDSFVLVDFWHFPNGAWRVPCWDALKAALRNPEIGLSSPVQPGKHIVPFLFREVYLHTEKKDTPFHTNTPAQALFFRSVLNGWLFKCSNPKVPLIHTTNISCFWQHQVEKRNQTRTTSQGNCKDSKCHLYINLSNKDQ